MLFEGPKRFLFKSFLLDQKGPKNQGSSEICLSSFRNFGKT
jgi:hypothetical protein